MMSERSEIGAVRDEIDDTIRLVEAAQAAVIGAHHDEAVDYSEGIGWLLVLIASRLRETEKRLAAFQK